MYRGKDECGMTQMKIPCSVYRGGTSRGLFFHESDLPKDEELKKKIFLHAIDAYNPSQINGLGSGTSHTSKVVVIGRSTKPNIDLEYTFYQIGIGTPVVDSEGTCGNLMAAVGAFAVNEGLVDCDLEASHLRISVFNTNIHREVKIDVPVQAGQAKVIGNYFMPGIVTPGSKYNVNIMDPGGAKTGKTAPLGNQSTVDVEEKTYDISLIDIVNPFVYVEASTLGLTGTEQAQEIATNEKVMRLLNRIRDEAAVQVGFASTTDEAKQYSSAVPKIAVVAKPQDYTTTSGEKVTIEQIDVMAKMVSMGKLHRTFAGSGLYNLAASTLLFGTIPNQLTEVVPNEDGQVIRIGHPDGIAEVRVALTEDQTDVGSVGLERTARLIIKGDVFIPE